MLYVAGAFNTLGASGGNPINPGSGVIGALYADTVTQRPEPFRPDDLAAQLQRAQQPAGVARALQDPGGVGEHPPDDLTRRRRSQEPRVERRLLAVHGTEPRPGPSFVDGRGADEGVEPPCRRVAVAHEEVTGHPHPAGGHVEPGRDLDDHHRQGDGDAAAPLEHVSEQRVAQVVVAHGVAGEAQLVAQDRHQRPSDVTPDDGVMA